MMSTHSNLDGCARVGGGELYDDVKFFNDDFLKEVSCGKRRPVRVFEREAREFQSCLFSSSIM